MCQSQIVKMHASDWYVLDVSEMSVEEAESLGAYHLEDGGRGFGRYWIGSAFGDGHSAWACPDCGMFVDDEDAGCDHCGFGHADEDDEDDEEYEEDEVDDVTERAAVYAYYGDISRARRNRREEIPVDEIPRDQKPAFGLPMNANW